MKKFLALVASVLTIGTGLVSAPAIAQPARDSAEKQNYIGPQVNFLNGTTGFGANSRFGIADNISVRPFIGFASSVTYFGASATYDFNLDNPGQPSSGFTPYAGVGFIGDNISSTVFLELGSDYNLSENIVLNANYRFRDRGFFSIGAGFKF
jgi:opacity protein-like surface antigen